AFEPFYTSLEVLLGMHLRLTHSLQLGMAGGLGVQRQPGTPDFHLLVRVSHLFTLGGSSPESVGTRPGHGKDSPPAPRVEGQDILARVSPAPLRAPEAPSAQSEPEASPPQSEPEASPPQSEPEASPSQSEPKTLPAASEPEAPSVASVPEAPP